MFDNLYPISEKLLEKGTVFKSDEIVIEKLPILAFKGLTSFFSLSSTSNVKVVISLLLLLPNSKIKYHNHENDSEMYIPINGEFEPKICKKGEGHELENTFNYELEVLSLKFVDS